MTSFILLLPMLYCTVKIVIRNFSVLSGAGKIVTWNFLMLYCTVKIVTGNFCMLFLFIFEALSVPSWNVRSFLSLCKERSISWNIRNFLRLTFLLFKLERLLLKYEEFFQGFHFLEYKKSFLLRKYKKFFGVSSSWTVRNFLRVDFFIFWAWDENCRVPFLEI